jgi:CheY-like chemotaxis protein
MDGCNATRRIRQRKAQRSGEEGSTTPVPVIALTASATEEHRRRCIEAGMSDVLHKPFTKRKLRRTLTQWLGGKGSDQRTLDMKK